MQVKRGWERSQARLSLWLSQGTIPLESVSAWINCRVTKRRMWLFPGKPTGSISATRLPQTMLHPVSSSEQHHQLQRKLQETLGWDHLFLS